VVTSPLEEIASQVPNSEDWISPDEVSSSTRDSIGVSDQEILIGGVISQVLLDMVSDESLLSPGQVT
jgi:hypothetical protein